MMAGRYPQAVPETEEPPVGARSGGGDGNGSLVRHRLAELEKRIERIEDSVRSIKDLCIEMNTKLDEKASKSYVLTIFGVTGGVAVFTFIGHVLLRLL